MHATTKTNLGGRLPLGVVPEEPREAAREAGQAVLLVALAPGGHRRLLLFGEEVVVQELLREPELLPEVRALRRHFLHPRTGPKKPTKTHRRPSKPRTAGQQPLLEAEKWRGEERRACRRKGVGRREREMKGMEGGGDGMSMDDEDFKTATEPEGLGAVLLYALGLKNNINLVFLEIK